MYEFAAGFAVGGTILAYVRIIRLERRISRIEQRLNRRAP